MLKLYSIGVYLVCLIGGLYCGEQYRDIFGFIDYGSYFVWLHGMETKRINKTTRYTLWDHFTLVRNIYSIVMIGVIIDFFGVSLALDTPLDLATQLPPKFLSMFKDMAFYLCIVYVGQALLGSPYVKPLFGGTAGLVRVYCSRDVLMTSAASDRRVCISHLFLLSGGGLSVTVTQLLFNGGSSQLLSEVTRGTVYTVTGYILHHFEDLGLGAFYVQTLSSIQRLGAGIGLDLADGRVFFSHLIFLFWSLFGGDVDALIRSWLSGPQENLADKHNKEGPRIKK